MEQNRSFLPLFVILASLVFLIISQILKSVKKFKTSRSNLPPGPWNLPLIGSMHHLVGSLPHHGLRALSQKYGPIMHLKVGEVPTVVVSSAEFAKFVLKTNDATFAERPHQIGADIMCYGSTDIATARYGGYWKQLRRICSVELLCAKRVRSFRSIREEEVMNLMRFVSVCANDGSCVNLSGRVASMTSAITGRTAFGEKCKHQDEFVSLLRKLVRLAEGFIVFDLFPSQKWLHLIAKATLEKLHRRFDVILEDIIRGEVTQRSGEDVEGLLSVLLNIKEHGALEYPLTINNIKAVIFDLFGAGIDTSTAVIEWAMSELLMNPGAMKRAQDEVREVFDSKGYNGESSLEQLTYLKAVIKETLRLHPPFPILLPRECRETCEIEGYTIAAGTKVIVNAWALARDPKYWIEAEKFFPERFLEYCPNIDYKGANIEYIPFGAGRRMCPGISFGVSSIELCLALLLYYFNWEIPSGDKGRLKMTEALGASARRKTDLVLVPIAYNPVPSL